MNYVAYRVLLAGRAGVMLCSAGAFALGLSSVYHAGWALSRLFLDFFGLFAALAHGAIHLSAALAAFCDIAFFLRFSGVLSAFAGLGYVVKHDRGGGRPFGFLPCLRSCLPKNLGAFWTALLDGVHWNALKVLYFALRATLERKLSILSS